MPIELPINQTAPLAERGREVVDTGGVEGSIRQRGVASWELRVYAGIDPESGGRRYRTATVRGNAEFETDYYARTRVEATVQTPTRT